MWYILAVILIISPPNVIKVYCIKKPQMGQFPYFAQLVIPLGSPSRNLKKSNRLYSLCGATLIHPRWLLTAARCFPNDTFAREAIERSTENEVFMGSYKFRDTYAKNSIIKIYRHPSFHWAKIRTDEQVRHDVAVIKLRGPFKITAFVKTIQLPANTKKLTAPFLQTCSTGLAIGTGGTISRYTTTSEEVPFVKVRPKRRSQLSQPMPPVSSLFYSEVFLSQSRGLKDNKGGPFVCNSSGMSIQYGIMSQQIQTKRTIVTTYERVDRYMSFIMGLVPDLNEVQRMRTRGSRNRILADTAVSGGVRTASACVVLIGIGGFVCK